MPKRLLNKKLLLPIASNIVAIIIFAVGWIIMKNIHMVAREDIGMSIIFLITLIISCMSYLWIILMTIGIIDIIDENKKNQ